MPVRKPKACLIRAQFGRNLVGLRQRLGLTQDEMALKSELSGRYIQSLEAGEYFPPLKTLLRLKAVVGCDWDDMFFDCKIPEMTMLAIGGSQLAVKTTT